MRRTRTADVVAAFVLCAVLGYAVTRLLYTQLPTLRWAALAPVALLAVADFIAAGRVRGAVNHRPGYKPITAVAVARCAGLGKASLLGGAAVAGLVVGLIVRLIPDVGRAEAARHDLVIAGVLLVAMVLLAGCGALLETAALDPSRRRKQRRP